MGMRDDGQWPDPDAAATGRLVDQLLHTLRRAGASPRALQRAASALGRAAAQGWNPIEDPEAAAAWRAFRAWLRRHRSPA